MSATLSLLNWYQAHKRDLPWRQSRDPYIIWVSEIILQQTRVAQGLPFFERFVEQFPTVQALALADEDKVLKAWEGLGYYSRARNLHHAAKTIVYERNGQLPSTFEEWLELKGVGDYTASAIMSIAYDAPYPVVDGNVFRVLARLFNADCPVNGAGALTYFKKLSQLLLPPFEAGTYNQALMELGATVCLPAQPRCDVCPLAAFCEAFKRKTWSILPVKLPKQTSSNLQIVQYAVLKDGYFLAEKRQHQGIWKGLHQLPGWEIAGTRSPSPTELLAKAHALFPAAGARITRIHPSVKHLLTHRNLFITFVELNLDLNKSEKTYLRLQAEQHASLAFPIAIRRFVDSWLSKEG